jgi:hypothetical protein
MSQEQDESLAPKVHPLAVDPYAKSASGAEPAFLNRPVDAPVYHGFQVLRDVEVEGFIFGKITDFESEPANEGDAFVIAPDNSRAGLVWKVSAKERFEEVFPVDAGRWGVWDVSFPYPMSDRGNVKRNLEAMLPRLKRKWEEWKAK